MFDIWQNGKFLPAAERDSTAKEFGLCAVPTIYQGILSLDGIRSLIRESNYSNELMGGIVIRGLKNPDLRGKYVGSDFITGQKHWSKYKITKNLLNKITKW